jgi:alpha-galactosidase
MLDPQRSYRVAPEQGEAREIAGSWLIRSGLPLPPMQGEAVLIYRLTAL